MRLRFNICPLISLYLSLSAAGILAKDLEEYEERATDEEEKPIEKLFTESSMENDFSSQSATTEASIAENAPTLVSILEVPEKKNVSRAFRPSAHLGEIKEPRTSANPFNHVQHIKFENEVDPNVYQEQGKNYQSVVEPSSHLPQANHLGNQQNFYETFFGSSEENKNVQNNFVKFQEDSADVPRVNYVFKEQPLHQPLHQQLLYPVTETGVPYGDPINQQIFQNFERPLGEQDAAILFGKPSKLQVDGLKHELGSYSNVDASRLPYFAGFYEQNHRPGLHDVVTSTKKPNNEVVYVQEATFMRTRKFPYTFYQPGVGYHQVEFLNDDHMAYPVAKRVSPWKKILHLIGAFLPFGLLLAALTPSVIRVENVTQPNIVLSKWRVADLPVEHKQARLLAEDRRSSVCEERSICEAISAGGGPGSSVLQNLLWNLATGTSTRVARENGLQELFEAVKRKDCTKVACRL